MDWISCVCRNTTDWVTGTDLGLFGVTGSIVVAVPPCESNSWPAEGVISQQMVSFACWSLLFYPGHAIEKLAWGWTFTFLIASCRKTTQTHTKKRATTWMDQPHQHTHCFRYSLLYSHMRKTGHAYHHTSKKKKKRKKKENTAKDPLTWPDNHEFSSVLFFMLSLLKAFS